MSSTLANMLVVALGGAIGATLRYCVSLIFSGTHSIFNWGTITVNILGSFIIGALFALLSSHDVSTTLRTFLFVGLLGGFTTFSSFSLDTVNIFRESGLLSATFYVLINNIGGICAAVIAIWIFSK